jgi:hypothetical protein
MATKLSLIADVEPIFWMKEDKKVELVEEDKKMG